MINNSIFFRIMIFGLVLNISWNATLISYLSTHKTNLPFNNLETLLSSTSYKIAVLPGSATADWFRYSSDPLTQRAWIERIEPYLDEFHTYSGMYHNNHLTCAPN